MSLEDIKRKRAQKPELRAAATEAAKKEAKDRMAKKGPSGAKPKAQPKRSCRVKSKKNRSIFSVFQAFFNQKYVFEKMCSMLSLEARSEIEKLIEK